MPGARFDALSVYRTEVRIRRFSQFLVRGHEARVRGKRRARCKPGSAARRGGIYARLYAVRVCCSLDGRQSIP